TASRRGWSMASGFARRPWCHPPIRCPGGDTSDSQRLRPDATLSSHVDELLHELPRSFLALRKHVLIGLGPLPNPLHFLPRIFLGGRIHRLLILADDVGRGDSLHLHLGELPDELRRRCSHPLEGIPSLLCELLDLRAFLKLAHAAVARVTRFAHRSFLR